VCAVAVAVAVASMWTTPPSSLQQVRDGIVAAAGQTREGSLTFAVGCVAALPHNMRMQFPLSPPSAYPCVALCRCAAMSVFVCTLVKCSASARGPACACASLRLCACMRVCTRACVRGCACVLGAGEAEVVACLLWVGVFPCCTPCWLAGAGCLVAVVTVVISPRHYRRALVCAPLRRSLNAAVDLIVPARDLFDALEIQPGAAVDHSVWC